MQLAQAFIEDDGHRRGQIQAAHPPGRHGNAQTALRMLLKQVVRQTLPFTPKQQAIPGLIGNTGIRPGSTGTETKQSAAGLGGLQDSVLKILKRRVALESDSRPVIQAGPPQRAFVEAKTQTAYEVQAGPRGSAQPGHIARIGRNFRFPQGDVKHG